MMTSLFAVPQVNVNREGEMATIKRINVLNAVSSIVWNNSTYIVSRRSLRDVIDRKTQLTI